MLEPPLPSWADYTKHWSRYRVRLLLLPLLGGLLGGVVFAFVPTNYVATSRVLASPQLTYVSLADTNEKLPLVTLDTAASMVRSDRVLNQVATAMQTDVERVEDAIAITAEPLTRVLIIKVNSADRGTSIAGARAAVTGLRSFQREVFDLDPSSVRQLRLRTAITRFNAQADLSEGDASSRAVQTLGVLETRLLRVIDGNRSNNFTLTSPRMRQFKPLEPETCVMSGVALGVAIAFLSCGRIRRASHDWAQELSLHSPERLPIR